MLNEKGNEHERRPETTMMMPKSYLTIERPRSSPDLDEGSRVKYITTHEHLLYVCKNTATRVESDLLQDL